MSKHAILRLDNGEKIDPNEFWLRFNQVTNLLRALGAAFEDLPRPNACEPREALDGVVALMVTVNDDLRLYFEYRTPKEAAAERAKTVAKYRLVDPEGPVTADLRSGSGESAGEGAQH